MTTQAKRLRRFVKRPTTLIILVLLGGVFGQNYQGRRDVNISQRRGCSRGIDERLTTINEQNRRICAFMTIASTAQQPSWRREFSSLALGEVATREERYTRVDPKHGGTFSCKQAYPAPSLFPNPIS